MTVHNQKPIVIKENTAMLIHEALARGHQAERMREAERIRRSHRLAHAKRWQRKAAAASLRARLASQAIV